MISVSRSDSEILLMQTVDDFLISGSSLLRLRSIGCCGQESADHRRNLGP